MNKSRSLISGIAASLLGALALIAPSPAHAGSLFSLDSIGFTVFQYAGYFISYAVSIVGMIIFTVEAFFLQIVLDMNFQIVNSLSVQFGFSIILAFANILFVAAVIVMAVATIVRYETYGAKQMLWRVVIAAIGVNFSLILAGTVINFSDQATKYFMNAAVPNAASDTGTSAFGDDGFVSNLAGAFNPQRMMNAVGVSTSSTSTVTSQTIDAAQDAAGGFFGALAGIMMTASMVILMTIFLGALLMAFVVRYLMLTLLLTIMPAVWLAWIFPFGKSLVNWWRDKFIKYTFFAPVSMFFLYLSMRSVSFINSAHILGESGGVRGAMPDGPSQGIGGFLYATFGKTLVEPLITQSFNFILISGTLWLGLWAASKLGIKAAAAGMGAMQSFGNSVKRQTIGRAQNRVKAAKDNAVTSSKNAATRTLDRIRTYDKNAKGESKLQRGGASLMEFGSRGGRLRQATVGAVSRSLGRAVSDVGTTDKSTVDGRVKAYSDSVKNLTTDAILKERERIASGSLVANPDYEAALFKELKDRKELGGLAKPTSPVVAAAMKKWSEANPNATKEETDTMDKQLRKDNEDAEKAYMRDLQKQLERAKDSGALKDIVEAAPRLAAIAPKGKTKDKSRNLSDIEAVAEGVAGVKGDNIAVIANDKDLFDYEAMKHSADAKEILKQQQLAAMSVSKLSNGQLKSIGDLNLDTIDKINNTIDFLEKQMEDENSELFHHKDATDADRKDVKNANKLDRKATEVKIRSLRKTLRDSVNFAGVKDDTKKNDRSDVQPTIDSTATQPVGSPTPPTPAAPTQSPIVVVGGGGKGPRSSRTF